MADKIYDLLISYPDFQLNQIIDPDAVDTNNGQIVTKVNQLVEGVNTLTQGGTGASNITLQPSTLFPEANTIQKAHDSISTYIKDNRDDINTVTAQANATDTRVDNIESVNTTQDNTLENHTSRLATQEAMTVTQNNRLDTLEAIESDTRLEQLESSTHLLHSALNAHDTRIQQNTDKGNDNRSRIDALGEGILTNIHELADHEQRVVILELKDELDEDWVQSVSDRVTANTDELIKQQEQLDDIAQISPNAELVQARESLNYGTAYNTLKQRLDDTEIFVGTDIQENERTQINFNVTGEDSTETWVDNVKLGDLVKHNASEDVHPILIANHELDSHSHPDIRTAMNDFVTNVELNQEIAELTDSMIESINVVDTKVDENAEQINILEGKLIGIGATGKPINDIEDANVSGFYMGRDVTGVPTSLPVTMIVDVYDYNFKTAYVISNIHNTPLYIGTRNVAGWAWQTVATTEKTDELQDEINILSTDRGYKTTKQVSNTVNLENGIYTTEASTADAPDDGLYALSVFNRNASYHAQLAMRVANNGGQIIEPTLYFRGENDKTRDGWKQIATTERTEILSDDFRNGWKNVEGGYANLTVVKNGNTVSVSGYITNPSIRENPIIFNIPIGFRPTKRTVVSTGYGYEIHLSGDVQIWETFSANARLGICFSYNI